MNQLDRNAERSGVRDRPAQREVCTWLVVHPNEYGARPGWDRHHGAMILVGRSGAIVSKVPIWRAIGPLISGSQLTRNRIGHWW